ncbi:MAG: hypothetical protein JO323_21225 [Acidobacteriia bacterium]|nr:hypothetical protein [Terriglobia bacterium]
MFTRSRFFTKFACSCAAVAFASIVPLGVPAQDLHSHNPSGQAEESAAEDPNAQTLLQVVRQATERFKDVAVAQAAGYVLQFGCVAGDDSGAMGLHYINADLLNSGVLDPTRPQIVIYEPMPGGGLQLIGADFLVFADAWNASHSSPPQLMGQLFHLFTSPNRFGLPSFYTLHVWAWKKNPNGAFVNWHPNVSCQSFTAL